MAPQDGNTGGPQSPLGGDAPSPRPAPPGPDDLVILARDDKDEHGVFYWLKREAYQDFTHERSTSMFSQAQHLVAQGVVLADIPVGSIPGVGAMCYLVNLSGLQRPPARHPSPKPPDDRPVFNPEPVKPTDPCLDESAPAIDDLVIVDRKGQKFYWVKKCEYQRRECELRQIDPTLEEQVRLLTDRGVVLADVPGGSIPGTDDMGCLVNLRDIHRPKIKEELQSPTPKPDSGPLGPGTR